MGRLIISLASLIISIGVLLIVIGEYRGIKKYYAGMCGVEGCVCYGRLHFDGKLIRYDLHEFDTCSIICSGYTMLCDTLIGDYIFDKQENKIHQSLQK